MSRPDSLWGILPVGVFPVPRILFLAAWGACLCAAPSLQVQRLLRIPAQQGQQVSNLKTDSQGNLIVAALIGPSKAAYAYTAIKKLDSSGAEYFSRLLPFVGRVALGIDSHDDIYIAGATAIPGAFPFTAKLTTGPEGGFLMKLRGRDGTIVYSTSWGAGVQPLDLVIDSSGQILVTGAAVFTGPTFPTTPGAYASPLGFMSTPAYLLRFSAAGDQLLFSARYGGLNKVCQGSNCIAIRFTSPSQVLLDAQGNIWLAGATNTTDLPLTADALKPTCGCGLFAGDGFLAEFTPDGSRLLYATYLGTSELFTALGGDDNLKAAIFDRAGHIWMAGATTGPDLPVTANAAQKQYSGIETGSDGFLLEYDPTSHQLLYATYFGSGGGSIDNLITAPDGTVWFSGHAPSSLPVPVSGFTRGADFLAAVDPVAHTITLPTRLVDGSAGAGLAPTPTGVAIAGPANVVALLERGAAPSLLAVINAASTMAAGRVSPIEIVSLYGISLGPATPAAADLTSGQAPTQLAGVQVLFDGKPAPILYVQSDQINAIVPVLVSGETRVTVINAAGSSNDALLEVATATPEAIKKNARLWAAALNEDGSINSDVNPAHPGSIVQVFATGFGFLSPIPVDGQVLNAPLPSLTRPVEVSVWNPYNRAPLEVLYAGPAPALVAGAIQVNFRLPAQPLGVPEPQFIFTVDGWQSEPFVILESTGPAPQSMRRAVAGSILMACRAGA